MKRVARAIFLVMTEKDDNVVSDVEWQGAWDCSISENLSCGINLSSTASPNGAYCNMA